MSRNKISSGGGWSDGEKVSYFNKIQKISNQSQLKVIFSLMEANGTIQFSKAYIPPGRTIKAVQHMIAGEKKRMECLLNPHVEETSTSNEDSPPAIIPPKSTKGPRASKAAKGKMGAELAKTDGKRKRAIKEEDFEETPRTSQEDPEVKKIKQEMKIALEEAENFRMENASGHPYGEEA